MVRGMAVARVRVGVMRGVVTRVVVVVRASGLGGGVEVGGASVVVLVSWVGIDIELGIGCGQRHARDIAAVETARCAQR